jgi:hypothetical protein
MKFFEGVALLIVILLFVVFVITTIFVTINYEDITHKVKRIGHKKKLLLRVK